MTHSVHPKNLAIHCENLAESMLQVTFTPLNCWISRHKVSFFVDQSSSVQVVLSNTAYPRVARKKKRYPVLHQGFSHIKFR